MLRKIISLIKNKKSYYGFLFVSALWFMVWGTYNTDITRMLVPGFPYNAIDLIHGLRSLLPFIALILAAIFLFKKRRSPQNFFLTPLGLLLIYAILGSVSSVFSKEPIIALYWSVLYGIVILVLMAVLVSSEPLKKLSLIININWVIAGILAVGLLVFFLIQPGVLPSFHANFLICYQRPYETIGNTTAAMETMGMVGTRPTGWGRYAGVMAIIALVSLFYSKKHLKVVWFLLFCLPLSILLFSKGRTEIMAFVIAMIFAVLLWKKINVFSIFGVLFVSLLAIFIVFYHIPCVNPPAATKILEQTGPAELNLSETPLATTSEQPLTPESPALITTPEQPLTPESPEPRKSVDRVVFQGIKNIATLSGRTNGVWLDSWYLFLSNPLVGYGFQADRFFLSGQHAHNSILQALVQAGVFGAVPFLLAFVFTFITLRKLFKRNLLGKKEKYFLIAITAALMFFAVRSITESVAFFSADWLFVAPMIAYIQCLGSNRLIKFHEN